MMCLQERLRESCRAGTLRALAEDGFLRVPSTLPARLAMARDLRRRLTGLVPAATLYEVRRSIRLLEQLQEDGQ